MERQIDMFQSEEETKTTERHGGGGGVANIQYRSANSPIANKRIISYKEYMYRLYIHVLGGYADEVAGRNGA